MSLPDALRSTRPAHRTAPLTRMSAALIALSMTLTLHVAPTSSLTLAHRQEAPAQVIRVTTTADELNPNGTCSLREAIQAANTDTAIDACPAGQGADHIDVPAGNYTLTLTGTYGSGNNSGDWVITDSVTLSGAGMEQTLLSGNQVDRVLVVEAGAVVTLQNLRIGNGMVWGDRPGSSQIEGGGIYNAGQLTLINAEVSWNTARSASRTAPGGHGGGIYNTGALTVTRSHITNNEAGYTGENLVNLAAINAGNGGGIYNTISGTVFIAGSVIRNRTSYGRTFLPPSGPGTGGQGGDGGSIYNAGQLRITTSLISGRTGYGGSIPAGASGTAGVGGSGGGIFNAPTGVVSITHALIVDNAVDSGGMNSDGTFARAGLGRALFGSNIALRNTLIGDMYVSPPFLAQCAGSVRSYGYNLITSIEGCDIQGDATGNIYGQDPQLGSGDGNGIRSTSPARDHGTCIDIDGNPVSVDLEGRSRPFGGQCDIGAFEWSKYFAYGPLLQLSDSTPRAVSQIITLKHQPDFLAVKLGADLLYTTTGATHWQTVNPPYTASVPSTVLAVPRTDPLNPVRLIVGAQAVNDFDSRVPTDTLYSTLYRTGDFGQTWATNVFTLPSPCTFGSGFDNLVASPAEPSRLYVQFWCGYEAPSGDFNTTANATSARAMITYYKPSYFTSVDAGLTWQPISNTTFSLIVPATTLANRVFDVSYYAFDDAIDIYQTDDLGATPKTYRDSWLHPATFAIDSRTPEKFYVITAPYDPPYRFELNGVPVPCKRTGFFTGPYTNWRSRDLQLIAHPTQTGVLFLRCVVDARNGDFNNGALYRSDNGGQTWKPLTDQSGYLLALDQDESSALGRLLWSTNTGLWASTDLGETWTRLTADFALHE